MHFLVDCECKALIIAYIGNRSLHLIIHLQFDFPP